MEAARSALIAGIAVCGLAAVVLSVLPWVTFENRRPIPDVAEVSESFSGLDISRSRDLEDIVRADAPHPDGWCSCDVAIGDGFFTAALGLLIIASAGVARFGSRFALGGGAAVAAALLIVALAGYNAVADGSAIVHSDSYPVTTDGAIQPALYALIAVGAIAAIDGTALWTMSREAAYDDEEEYDYDDNGEDPMEGTEEWA